MRYRPPSYASRGAVGAVTGIRAQIRLVASARDLDIGAAAREEVLHNMVNTPSKAVPVLTVRGKRRCEANAARHANKALRRDEGR